MRLVPHPSSAPAPVREFDVAAERLADGGLALSWTARGDMDQVLLPPVESGEVATLRRDLLWHHTCFEAFLNRGGSAYRELNFGPSGGWAAYRFSTYREGMANLELPGPPLARWERSRDRLHLEVLLDAWWLEANETGAGALRIGMTGIIEDVSGTLTYWGLSHPSPAPDFHNAASFLLENVAPASTPAGHSRPSAT